MYGINIRLPNHKITRRDTSSKLHGFLWRDRFTIPVRISQYIQCKDNYYNVIHKIKVD